MARLGAKASHRINKKKMTKAIQIDPKTGLKIFNTKASLATQKIKGQGYSINSNVKSKSLPNEPVGAVFDAKEQAKYKEFKEKRFGAANYMDMKGEEISNDDIATIYPIFSIMEDFQNLINILKISISRDKTNVEYLEVLRNAYMQVKDYENAENIYQMILELE